MVFQLICVPSSASIGSNISSSGQIVRFQSAHRPLSWVAYYTPEDTRTEFPNLIKYVSMPKKHPFQFSNLYQYLPRRRIWA